MRAIERTILRAAVPVRFSQGFNPRPILSLPCPRPLGIATEDDPLVVTINPLAKGEMTGDVLLEKLNIAAPAGVRFISATKYPGKIKPQPQKVTYRLDLPTDESAGRDNNENPSIADRIDQLSQKAQWKVERKGKPTRRGQREPSKTLDLKGLVENLALTGSAVEFTLFIGCGSSARPGEVLELIKLNNATNLARLLRTKVHIEPDYKTSYISASTEADGKNK